MRKIPLPIIIIFLFLSCMTPSEKTNQIVKKEYKPIFGKKFFDYDQIDHYFNNFDDRKFLELNDNQSKSELDAIKAGILFGFVPKAINDTSFIEKLTTIEFVKNNISRSKFQTIDSIFTEKAVKDKIAFACVHIYRDILIFKKQKKVIGIAKVCFNCKENQIIGTNANTKSFGQDGDYDKLQKLVR